MALVQSKITFTTGADTLALSFDATPTVNNLIVVGVSAFNGVTTCTVSDNQGNTWAQAAERLSGDSSTRASLHYAVAATSSGTFTVTTNPSGASSDITIVIAEFSGMATSSVLGNVNNNGGTSTTPSSGSATTTVASELVVGVVSHTGTDRTITEDGGWTLIREDEGGSSHMPISMIYQEPAAGSYNAGWTIGTGSVEWMAVIGCFKPGAGAAGQPTSKRWQNIPHAGPRLRIGGL
jgi:hypothetical protein